MSTGTELSAESHDRTAWESLQRMCHCQLENLQLCPHELEAASTKSNAYELQAGQRHWSSARKPILADDKFSRDT